MKTLLKSGFALAVLLCLILSSCAPETPAPQLPQPEPGEVFRTIYRFPLGMENVNSGPSMKSGEIEILNESAIAQENGKLAAVLAQILDDIRAKRIVPTPIDLPEEVPYGDDYALKAMASVSKTDGFSDGDYLQGFEVEYEGTARNGVTSWKTLSLRFVYIDQNQNLPDKMMFQLSPQQIAPYNLENGEDGMLLLSYLNQKTLEGYPIMVENRQETIRFKSYEEAVHYHALMEAGDVDHLIRNPS